MFIEMSNTTFNTTCLNEFNVSGMESDKNNTHASLLRLYERSGISTPMELAVAMNESPQTINNWAGRGVSKQGAIKASEIFENCPVNYVLKGIESSNKAPSLVVHSFQKEEKDFITISQFTEVGASMGKGVLLAEQPGQITSWQVTQEWLSKNIPSNTGASNLCIITGFGDSMKGMFNPGDPIVVDIGVNACKHDGVYFFRVADEGFVKRLQRIPGKGIKVISVNPEYESWLITPDMDFAVLGKVLKVWESTEF